MKDKESELKGAEQKLHDEFERLRRQNAEEKRQLDDKKKQLVSLFVLLVWFGFICSFKVLLFPILL